MLTLTKTELAEVTGYKWREKQIVELHRQRVPFRVNGRGALIVFRSDLQNRGKAKQIGGATLEISGPLSILQEPCVYFLQFVGDRSEPPGKVKIGFSTNLIIRRLQIPQSLGYSQAAASWFEVLGTVPGDRKKEAELHALFDQYRIFGEWFIPAPEILEYPVVKLTCNQP